MSTPPAQLVRSEHRFTPPAGAEPIPVAHRGARGSVLAHIHPNTCELRVIVHRTVGVYAEVVGPAVHERTHSPNHLVCLTAAWTPDGANAHTPLAEAPDWVQAAVREVTSS